MEADSSYAQQPQLPSLFVELIEHSCLLPALASYLRNDSGKLCSVVGKMAF